METIQSAFEPSVSADARKGPGKRGIRMAILVFVLMLIALTLLSNTLLTYSLPQVSVEKAAPGMLSHDVSGTGSIVPAETADLIADSRLVVDQVLVKTGDTVTVGQQLLTLRTADTRNSLLDEQARYQQKKLSLDKMMENYVEAQKSGTEKQIRDLSRDIDSMKLDLQIQERKIAQLQDQVNGGAQLVSTVNGVVAEVNATAGLTAGSGRSAVRVTNKDKGYQFKLTVDSEKANYLTVGDDIEVIVKSLSNARIKGKLTALNDPAGSSGQTQGSSSTAGRKEMVVDLKDNRLKGGEAGEIFFSKKMPPSRMLLSNQSIREDDQGKYVYVMKEKKGALGNEFYAQRANVTVSDSDDSKSAVENGITPMDQIITSSSKSIAVGDRIMMAD
jgi:HlyD family secretion protein